MSKEDLDSTDIMAYSATNADNADDESSLFGEGGAIMDALQEANPSLKEKPAPPKKTKPAVKKPSKAEIEKKKHDADIKRKAEEEVLRK